MRPAPVWTKLGVVCECRCEERSLLPKMRGQKCASVPLVHGRQPQMIPMFSSMLAMRRRVEELSVAQKKKKIR